MAEDFFDVGRTAAESESLQPRRYVGKDGLEAEVLRRAVNDQLILACRFNDQLWRFVDGVWKDDGERAVERTVAILMGDDYRPAHARNVITSTIAMTSRVIADEPVADYINFRNGLLDWRTDELFEHTPDVPAVNQVPHRWEPEATCPRFDRFLTEVLHPDAVGYAEEILGYALYDGNPFQVALLALGGGSNGKSVFLGVMAAICGGDNVSAVPLQVLGENRFAAGNLHGKLANIAGDLPPKTVTNTAVFKAITGGDPIFADRKFKEPFQFHARAFPAFSANEIPASEDAGHGYLRRWLTLEFPNRFEGDRRDPHILDTLRQETPGILVKAVAGLRRLMERGQFEEPDSVGLTRGEFERHVDPVRSFVSECLETAATDSADRRQVYQAYRVWTSDEGSKPLSAKRFAPRLRSVFEELGWDVEETKVAGNRRWHGVRLTATIERDGRGHESLRAHGARLPTPNRTHGEEDEQSALSAPSLDDMLELLSADAPPGCTPRCTHPIGPDGRRICLELPDPM